MLSVEQNKRVTEVGPGTPMGELMRRYWQVVAVVSELDDDPVKKVKLLGEDLVLFRTRSGEFGLIGDRCAHRCVAMEYGIPEDDGLRCPYHGWLYDTGGQCIETPLEPSHSKLKDKVKIAGYPVQEMGGLIFAYLGPDPVPVLPPWDFFVWPNSLRQVGITEIPCNWLQCQENAADPVHSVYLHGHYFRYILEREGMLAERAEDPTTHRSSASIDYGRGYEKVIFEVDQYGMKKGVRWSKDLGADADRERWHSYMIFPNMTRPGGGAGVRHEFQIRVPMDDVTTRHYNYTIYVAPGGVTPPEQQGVPHYHVPMTDENGKPILDFVVAQDLIAWAAQGPVSDRSKEHLGGTDAAIIRFRKLLEEQLQAMEQGKPLINVFHDRDEVGDVIIVDPPIDDSPAAVPRSELSKFRAKYHQGYWRDDADRYGPDIELVQELMRRVEVAATENAPSG